MAKPGPSYVRKELGDVKVHAGEACKDVTDMPSYNACKKYAILREDSGRESTGRPSIDEVGSMALMRSWRTWE